MGENNLSRRQHAALSALLTEPSVVAAAAAAGVSERSLFRWLKDDPEFKAAYLEDRREALSQTTARLQAASAAAVTSLCNVMEPV